MLRFQRRALTAVIAGTVLAASACDPLPPPSDEIKVIHPTYADGSPVHESRMLNDRGEFSMVDPATRWTHRDSIWSDGEVFNLGTDDVNVRLEDISNHGHVVGSRLDVLPYTSPPERPCWTPSVWVDGEGTDLPVGDNGVAGEALAVNDHGHVAGFIRLQAEEINEGDNPCTKGGVLPVVWKDGEIIEPPAESPLRNSEHPVYARGISNEGHVVLSPATGPGVVIWEVGGEIVELDFDGGTTRVVAINERGMVLLHRSPGMYWEQQALLWHDGKLTEIGGGDDTSYVKPSDLNVWGQVVGTSHNVPADGRARGFLWYQGEMTWLETPDDSGESPYPSAINNWGQVVGGTWDPYSNRGTFLWQNGHIIDLDELIDDPDISLTLPIDINNNGQILGRSTTASTRDRAVIWEVAPLWPGYPDGL